MLLILCICSAFIHIYRQFPLKSVSVTTKKSIFGNQPAKQPKFKGRIIFDSILLCDINQTNVLRGEKSFEKRLNTNFFKSLW